MRESYHVDVLLRDPDWHGSFEDISEQVADTLGSDDEPADTVDRWIEDAERYIRNLRQIAGDFEAFKATAIDMPNPDEAPPEDDTEAYAAWDKAYDEAEANPRYRVPTLTSEAA